jgi:hypothetical protein
MKAMAEVLKGKFIVVQEGHLLCIRAMEEVLNNNKDSNNLNKDSDNKGEHLMEQMKNKKLILESRLINALVNAPQCASSLCLFGYS